MGCNKNKKIELDVAAGEDRCCTATTGCEFDGTLNNVVAEPIFVQKVYDAALFNLQALVTVTNRQFTPVLGPEARIIRVTDIRCRRFFNPNNINDNDNLTIKPKTEIAGADIVKNNSNKPVEVIGPDGTASEVLLYTNTEECDEEGRGTTIFGTQDIKITGDVVVEIDVVYEDEEGDTRTATLTSNVTVGTEANPLILTNFFELCLPSVFDSAFLPRFTEFCNVSCEARLATNSIMRDIVVNPATGAVRINLIITLCITCEKKIIVPVQLCVLSTGFPVLAAEIATVCPTFPSLFPRQIDENNNDD